jgi:TPR repeat protein
LTTNTAEAAKLHAKACDFGDNVACVEMGNALRTGTGIAQDASAAANRFEEACDYGKSEGCTMLADMLVKGEGRAKDASAAAILRERAKQCTRGQCLATNTPRK